jgi:hypothetical protein
MRSETNVRRSRVKGDKALQRLRDSLGQAQVSRRIGDTSGGHLGARRCKGSSLEERSVERSRTYRVTIHVPFSPRLHGEKKRSAGAPHGWMTRAVHSKPRVCRKECDCLQHRGLQYPGKGLADQNAPCTPAGSAPCVEQRPADAYGPGWRLKQFGSYGPHTAHSHTQARARARELTCSGGG